MGSYVPSMGLGSRVVTPMDMASVYSTLAAGGVYSKPMAIRKVVLPGGKVDTEAGWGVPRQRAVPDWVAAEVVRILEENMTSGTGVPVPRCQQPRQVLPEPPPLRHPPRKQVIKPRRVTLQRARCHRTRPASRHHAPHSRSCHYSPAYRRPVTRVNKLPLKIFNCGGYKSVRSSPVLARKNSMRPGRYCIRFSRVFTSVTS